MLTSSDHRQPIDGSESFDRSLVVLAHAYPGYLNGQNGGEALLRRELWRQAMLIAAHDEMRLPVYDEVLSGPVDPILNMTAPGWENQLGNLPNTSKFGPLMPHIQGEQSADFRLYRLEPGRYGGHVRKPVLKLQTPVQAGGASASSKQPYRPATEQIERLSRTWLVQLLQAAAFKPAGNPLPASTATVPAPVEALLQQPSPLAQFAAVRTLHDVIRQQGESPQLLYALSRGYAQLGAQTDFLWNATSQVYTARALLYAQRAVVVAPSDPHGLWCRAYALALAGLHREALIDLARAADLTANSVTRPAIPAWVALIRPLCRYDGAALKKLADDDASITAWALHLHFETQRPRTSDQALLDAGLAALKAAPDDLTIIDGLADRMLLEPTLSLSRRGLDTWVKSLPVQLRQIAQLPARAETILKQLESAAVYDPADVDALANALIESSPLGQDATHPSWADLGWLVREITFATAFRRAQFVHETTTLSAAQVATEKQAVMPLVSNHPYWNLVHTFIMRREPIDPNTMLSKMPGRDIVPAMNALRRYQLTQNTGRDGKPQLFTAASGDYVAREVPVLEVSPFNPAARRWVMQERWHEYAARARAWQRETPNEPEVLRGLAQRALIDRHWPMARQHLEAYLRQSPDAWGYAALADTYLVTFEPEKHAQVLEEALAKMGPHESGRAALNATLARHWLVNGDGARALAAAQAAAAGGDAAHEALLVNAYEAAGQTNAAAVLLATAAANRRADSAFTYYRWCVRTGKGDVNQARKLVQDSFALQQKDYATGSRHLSAQDAFKREPHIRPMELCMEAIFQLTDGNAAAACNTYTRFTDPPDEHVLYAVVVADAMGRTADRDQWLKRINSSSGFPAVNHPWRPQLAWVFQRTIAGEPFDAAMVQVILDAATPAERPEIAYLAGAWLKSRGPRRLHESLLRQALGPIQHDTWAEALAARMLRDGGADPQVAPATQPAAHPPDSFTVDVRLVGPIQLFITRHGLYWTRSTNVREPLPTEAFVDDQAWALKFCRYHAHVLNPPSNCWAMPFSALQYRLAAVTASATRGGPGTDELAKTRARPWHGVFLVDVEGAVPEAAWYRLRFVRDTSRPDALKTAPLRPLEDIERDDMVPAQVIAAKQDPYRLPADEVGDTRLHHLVAGNDTNAVWEFLAVEGGVEERNEVGCTPLHLAGNPVVIEMLVRAGARIDAKNLREQTPLHYAAGLGTTAGRIDALVKCGAAVNSVDYKGRTPLHHAAMSRSKSEQVLKTVERLLAAGGDRTLKDKDGKLPEDLATNPDVKAALAASPAADQ